MDRASPVPGGHAAGQTGVPARTDVHRMFERGAWLTLACAVVVIVWGAVVRATGSGAGCGAHWPLCNGQIVPLAPRVSTIIEFTHRASSGLLVVLTAGLAVMAWRLFPPRHGARRAAAASFVFVMLEAAIGAGIVLLGLVERNASALRAGYIAAHLVNTMLLVAALTATAWASRPRPAGTSGAARLRLRRGVAVGLGALVVVSAAGAVVALGDTLFPQASLAAGLAADFNPTSHALVRLRYWHPLVAIGTSLYLSVILGRGDALDDPAVRPAARITIALVVAQVALGALNVLTLAPLTIQMAHLLVSNLLWIALVWVWLQLRPTSLADVGPSR